MKAKTNQIEEAIQQAYNEGEYDFPFSLVRECLEIEQSHMYAESHKQVTKKLREIVNTYLSEDPQKH